MLNVYDIPPDGWPSHAFALTHIAAVGIDVSHTLTLPPPCAPNLPGFPFAGLIRQPCQSVKTDSTAVSRSSVTVHCSLHRGEAQKLREHAQLHRSSPRWRSGTRGLNAEVGQLSENDSTDMELCSGPTKDTGAMTTERRHTKHLI